MSKSFRIIQVILETDQDLLSVRQRTKDLANMTGLDLHGQTRLVTALSELARNALQYAGKSIVAFGIEQNFDQLLLTISIADKGPGIKDLDLVMSDQYISKTGLGKGMKGAKRLVDDFAVQSTDQGTTVTVKKLLPANVAHQFTGSLVSEWAGELAKKSPIAPIEELKNQNAQMVATLQEVEETKRDLEKADKFKSQFLANMSHEIRTPMNALLGLASLMERTPLSDEQSRLLRLMKDSGSALLNIINDILDLSKIEAGKFVLDHEAFDLVDLLERTVDLMRQQAAEKDSSISLNQELPRQIFYGDKNRIRQILLNFLSNAIKFSQADVIEVRVSPTNNSEISSTFVFEVRDHGIGIDPDSQKQLFRPFTQVDSANSRRHGGTGLGLSICKRLVELMGGKIGLRSEAGLGSTFWFSLDLEHAQQVQEVKVESGILPENFSGVRILLAEDHPINQMVATTELERFGADVDVVSDGAEAVRAVTMKHYDVVLMDCQMPVLDGCEATRELRSQNFSVPIIAMTASAMAGDREDCLRAGMNDYLTKPFQPEQLFAAIARWLPKKNERAADGAESDAPKKTQPVTAPTDVQPIIDFAKLKARYAANSSKLVTAYLEDLKMRADLMTELFEKEDYVKIKQEAHSLIGASGLVFAERLISLFRDLETACAESDKTQVSGLLPELNELVTNLADQVPPFLDGDKQRAL